MNLSELRKNIGRTFRFIPLPRRDSSSGSWVDDKNLWVLRREVDGNKGFEFLNVISDHDPLILDHIQIRNFDAPDQLLLRDQVILKGSAVLYESFFPQPASLALPNTSLRLSLGGSDGQDEFGMLSPPLDPINFVVANTGQQTVRDYRNVVLIPKEFSRTTSSSYLGNLSTQEDTEIDGRTYAIFGNFVSIPIYKNETVNIGVLRLKADPGDYDFLWQIRCDEGTFPAEGQYGKINVQVKSLGDFVDRAVDGLYRPPKDAQSGK
jgi:hypothetical protein